MNFATRAFTKGLMLLVTFQLPLAARSKSPIEVKLAPVGRRLKLSVKNLGARPLKIYDSFTEREALNLPVWVQARGQNLKVLTEASFLPDSYWSPSLCSSHGTPLPLKLREIGPSQSLEREVDVSELFTGYYPSASARQNLTKKTREVRARFRLYLDSKLQCYIDSNSGWFSFTFEGY